MPTPSPTQSPQEREADALRLLRAGQLEGLKGLYDLYAEPLLNLAWRMLRRREAAEDAVHDLFVRMPHVVSGFRHECSLKTWLFRAMHNQCLNWIAVENNRQNLLRREMPDALAHEPHASNPDPEKTYETAQLVQRAFELVPPETRSLLWMKDAEGVSLDELVLIFQEPEGTLKARLSRARHLMRETLAKELNHG
jgi:RNA polymerase sigma-70 factor, ECF subfamily